MMIAVKEVVVDKGVVDLVMKNIFYNLPKFNYVRDRTIVGSI